MTWTCYDYLDVDHSVHVIPDDDLIAHEHDDCVCGPEVEPVPRNDGSMAWLLTHSALDGREG